MRVHGSIVRVNSCQPFTSLGRVVLVLLDSPLLFFDGSELLGLGAALLGAVPDGVLDIVPLDDVSGIVLEDDEDGLIDEDEDGLVEDDDELIGDEDFVDVLSVVVDVDGAGIDELVSVLGIAGGSVLLQAPRTARVAARATHLIVLRMFTPRGQGQNPRVRARPWLQRRS